MTARDRLDPTAVVALTDHILRSGGTAPPVDLEPYFRQWDADPGESFPSGPSACRYFVVSGCVQVTTPSGVHADFVHQFGLPSWWVGDEGAFVRREPTGWTVGALVPSTVLALDTGSQERLLAAWPPFGRYLLWVYQRAYAALQQRLFYAERLGAEARYDLLVRTQPDFVQRVPQHRLAAYLGISPEHLSRLRRRRVGS